MKDHEVYQAGLKPDIKMSMAEVRADKMRVGCLQNVAVAGGCSRLSAFIERLKLGVSLIRTPI